MHQLFCSDTLITNQLFHSDTLSINQLFRSDKLSIHHLQPASRTMFNANLGVV